MWWSGNRDLRIGEFLQFTVVENEEGRFRQYREDVSKTIQGGLKYRRIKQKCIVAYENKQQKLKSCVIKL